MRSEFTRNFAPTSPRSLTPPTLRVALAIALAVCVDAAVCAQTVFDIPGTAFEQQLGRAIVGLGDVDSDGVPDFAAAGAANFATGARVKVFSGATGALLLEIVGNAADGFGAHLAAGDVDADGVQDLVVSAPDVDVAGANVGRVVVHRATSGAVLWQSDGLALHNAARPVAVIADRTGDGKPEVVVGTPNAGAGAGRLDVLSGANGIVVATVLGNPGNSLGATLATVGDVNGDNVGDYAVTAPGVGAGGRVTIRSGTNDAVLRTLDWPTSGDEFGSSLAGVGDATGDSIADLAIGVPRSDIAGSDKGAVVVVSGASGAAFKLLLASDLHAGAQLGFSVAGAGDVDGDGRGDAVAGAPFPPTFGKAFDGRVKLYSGGAGAELHSYMEYQYGTRLGWSVASVGDLDGDGVAEFATGAPQYIVPPGLVRAGLVRVIDPKCARTYYHGSSCSPPGDTISAWLAINGCIKGGSTVDFTIAGHAGTTALLMVGTPGGPTPIGATGCALNLATLLPFVFAIPMPAGTGYASLVHPNTIPPGALPDGTFAVQAFDTQGSTLVSASMALAIAIY